MFPLIVKVGFSIKIKSDKHIKLGLLIILIYTAGFGWSTTCDRLGTCTDDKQTNKNKQINQLTSSLSRKANISLASQEIPLILWCPKIHYLIHKCRPGFRFCAMVSISSVKIEPCQVFECSHSSVYTGWYVSYLLHLILMCTSVFFLNFISFIFVVTCLIRWVPATWAWRILKLLSEERYEG